MNLKSPVFLPKSVKFLCAGSGDEVVHTAGKPPRVDSRRGRHLLVVNPTL